MLKRILFTLLYEDGSFVLSRNFRLQKVGDVHWLKQNYDFRNVAASIDELVILDVSRNSRDMGAFASVIREVTADCFVPVAVGGGITGLQEVEQLMLAGADKVVINSLLAVDPDAVTEISQVIGAQSVVASIDIRRAADDRYRPYYNRGALEVESSLSDYLQRLSPLPIGEFYINSIDRDGTGKGLDLDLVQELDTAINQPIILAGGVGHSLHLHVGLIDPRVNAVATANLLNFVGDGLQRARSELRSQGIPLAEFGIA